MNGRDLRQFAGNLRLGDDSIWVGTSSPELSYPSHGNESCFQVEDESFWFQHRNRCIAAALKLFPPPGALFDIGGGNGFVSAGLRAAGFDTVLVEPGVDGARNARRRGIPDVVCATIEDAGFIPGSLPAVGMFDVLEHVEDHVGFLRTLRELMQPGGRIYIAVPAFNALWSNEDKLAGHFRRYTLSSLKSALHTAGFAAEHETYLFQALWLPIVLFRAMPTRLRLSRSASYTDEQVRRDHVGRRNALLSAVLDREYRRIADGKRISFGSSCFVVARA